MIVSRLQASFLDRSTGWWFWHLTGLFFAIAVVAPLLFHFVIWPMPPLTDGVKAVGCFRPDEALPIIECKGFVGAELQTFIRNIPAALQAFFYVPVQALTLITSVAVVILICAWMLNQLIRSF